MFKNEKGSIPTVIIIGLVSAFTVFLLGNLLVAENIAAKKQNLKFEQEVYASRNALETTVNVVLQKISSSETKYEKKNIFPMYITDMQEIENTINTSILPHIAPNNTVSITNLKYDKSLDMICDEKVTTNPYTQEGEASGVNCSATPFNLTFDVEINNQNNKRKMKVKLDKLYAQESNQTGFIKINYDNMDVNYSSL
ncbi:hypothetical protein [Bacillus thuringiensis]|uniref:hypothetical protein n=1 Tax=Bacillus thuringiensis TaxID=1428 RepID=UPI0021D657D4|nr:hypothetical protein [Bacillus thuringiensis]MCU7668037.1 hypothetical protein [Bacillus thuringiensis]